MSRGIIKMLLCVFLICSLNSYGQSYWTKNYRIVSTQSFKEGKITLKKKINPHDYRKNPDGTKYYKTIFAIDLEYNNSTTTSIIETDAYTTAHDDKGMRPCMLIEADKNTVSIFSNSKASDKYYGMNGFVYRIDMNDKYWKKEIVFTGANYGWFSFFGGSDNGNPELWHFSYAGYYSMLSKRNSSGNWSTKKIGSIRPETAEQRCYSHQNILVASSSGADRMSAGNNSSNSSSSSSSSSGLSDKNIAAAAGVIGSAVMIYGLYKLFTSGSSDDLSSNQSSSTTSDEDETDIYMLTIGVADYKNHPDLKLNYSDDDAYSISSRIKQGEGDSRLFWNKVYTKTLTNSSATKANIEDGLSWVRRNANKNDIIIIHISSHGGCADYDNNNDCDGELYLTPYEFDKNRPKHTSVKIDDIIRGLDCEKCATLIWLDACHAGRAGNDFNNNIDDYIRAHMGRKVNILVSSNENESSQERPQWEHGAFTKAILDGLNGKADQNSNNIISLRELTEYVIRRVPNMTNNEQHPYNPIKLFPNTQLSAY
jgi:hypothetical protein